MKRTEGNIGESEKTSVKVHHAPGGQSNFSLGWGNDQAPQQAQKGKPPLNSAKYHNQSSIVFGDEPKPAAGQARNQPQNTGKQQAQEAPKVVQEAPKVVQEAPKPAQEQPAKEAPKTSVKVHNPPGGKSSISFG